MSPDVSSADDWLEGAPEDWIDGELPAPTLTVKPALPTEYGARLTMLQAAWVKLNDKQRRYLSIWRECRLNGRKAAAIAGIARSTVISWNKCSHFVAVRDLWRAEVGEDALNRDRLLARQDDIVETLLTPKPVLHQGADTGFREVDAGAASRANETLMKAAGMLKDKDLEINVGMVGPSLVIQVVQPTGALIDVSPKFVDVNLPEPQADGA